MNRCVLRLPTGRATVSLCHWIAFIRSWPLLIPFAALLPSHPRGGSPPLTVVIGPGIPLPVRRPGPFIPGHRRGGNRRPAASRPSRPPGPRPSERSAVRRWRRRRSAVLVVFQLGARVRRSSLVAVFSASGIHLHNVKVAGSIDSPLPVGKRARPLEESPQRPRRHTSSES